MILYNKRLGLADRLAEKFGEFAEGVLLTGSMAYADDTNISQNSDIDFILVCDSLRKALYNFLDPSQVDRLASRRHFDAVCLSLQEEGVDVSVHIMRPYTIDWISLTYVGDLRVFRTGGKNTEYKLFNFEGGHYQYQVKNIETEDCNGFRTIVPVGFLNNDTYHIGIHREKLLCNPKIYKDNIGVSKAINQNWWKTVKIFKADAERVGYQQLSFYKGLSKYDNFSAASKTFVAERLDHHMNIV